MDLQSWAQRVSKSHQMSALAGSSTRAADDFVWCSYHMIKIVKRLCFVMYVYGGGVCGRGLQGLVEIPP